MDTEKSMFCCKTLLHIAAGCKTASHALLEAAKPGLFRKQLKNQKIKCNSAIRRCRISTEACHSRQNTRERHQYFKYRAPGCQTPVSVLEGKRAGGARTRTSPCSNELARDPRPALSPVLSEAAGAEQLASANQHKASSLPPRIINWKK